jgi:hypothetical protein
MVCPEKSSPAVDAGVVCWNAYFFGSPPILMGIYNTLRVTMICPRCRESADMEIEIKFGDTRGMDKYSIGDRYKWILNKAVHNGGRPENGNIDGEGYGECPLCDLDFFVKVLIRNDVICSLEPDLEKLVHIPTVGEDGKQIVKEFFSPDSLYLIEILRRSDGLYEILGYQRGFGLQSLDSYLGQLTDTLDNAEKLARESLMALTGRSDDEAFGRIILHEDLIPPELPRFSYIKTVPEASFEKSPDVAPIKNNVSEAVSMSEHGKITYNPNWKLTNKRKVALLRLAELGVDVYSSVSSDNFRLLVPFKLHPDVYVEIGYLMAKLGEDDDFPDHFHHPISDAPSKLFDGKMGYNSPVSADDSLPQGFRYTVTPKEELRH